MRAVAAERLRLFFLKRLERLFDGVVCGSFALHVVLDLRHLLGNGLGDGLERLLNGVLGKVPVELGHIGDTVDIIGQQVLRQFVLFVLECLAQVLSNLAGNSFVVVFVSRILAVGFAISN